MRAANCLTKRPLIAGPRQQRCLAVCAFVIGLRWLKPQDLGRSIQRGLSPSALRGVGCTVAECTFAVPEGFRGDPPPPAEHDNQVLAEVGRGLWYGGDDMMTASAFMADHLWAVKGEDPAQMAAVGTAIRNTGSCLLEGEWWDAVGEFEVAGTAGDSYFDEQPFLKASAYFNGDDEDWDKTEIHSRAATSEAFAHIAGNLEDAAERVKTDELSSMFLLRAGESVARIGQWLGKPELLASIVVEDSPTLPADVSAEISAAQDYETRRTVLKKFLAQYHPDQNPGEEESVLPVFLELQNLREQLEKSRS